MRIASRFSRAAAGALTALLVLVLGAHAVLAAAAPGHPGLRGTRPSWPSPRPDSVRDLQRRLTQALNAGDANAAATTIRELAQTNDEAAIRVLIQIALADNLGGIATPQGRNTVYDAVGTSLRGVTDPAARRAIYELKEHRDWRVRALLVEVLGDDTSSEATGVLNEMVANRRENEDVVAAAARALGRRRAHQAVSGLIDALERLERGQGTAYEDVRGALREILGQDLRNAEEYRGYWNAHRDSWDPARDRQDPSRSAGTHQRESPQLFGSEITSRRVVIVLDVSGSMHIKDPGGDEGAERPNPAPGGGTSGRQSPPPAPPGGGQGGAGGNQGTRGVCPECSQTHGGIGLAEFRRRIVRAKAELERVVMALPANTRFALVVYSTTVRHWQQARQLVPATDAAKRSAVDFVRGLQADGVTQTGQALEETFEYQEADTIYLISDGTPTDEGGNALPETAQEPTAPSMDKIYERMQELNRFRHVRINTLSFQGAYPPFMRRLAGDSGGEYREIP